MELNPLNEMFEGPVEAEINIDLLNEDTERRRKEQELLESQSSPEVTESNSRNRNPFYGRW